MGHAGNPHLGDLLYYFITAKVMFINLLVELGKTIWDAQLPGKQNGLEVVRLHDIIITWQKLITNFPVTSLFENFNLKLHLY